MTELGRIQTYGSLVGARKVITLICTKIPGHVRSYPEKSKYASIDVAIQSAVAKFHYDRPLVWRSWSREQTWHSVADSWHLALRGEAAAESESKGQNWQKAEAVDQEAR